MTVLSGARRGRQCNGPGSLVEGVAKPPEIRAGIFKTAHQATRHWSATDEDFPARSDPLLANQQVLMDIYQYPRLFERSA
jgi:hypothetical protein